MAWLHQFTHISRHRFDGNGNREFFFSLLINPNGNNTNFDVNTINQFQFTDMLISLCIVCWLHASERIALIRNCWTKEKRHYYATI